MCGNNVHKQYEFRFGNFRIVKIEVGNFNMAYYFKLQSMFIIKLHFCRSKIFYDARKE